MKRLMKEIHSKPDSFFKKKRSHSFHQNINITERISPSNNLNPIQNLKIDNYILNKKLGQGTFGIVVLAIHEMTGEKVAIKILDKEKIFKNSEKIRFERKIQIMKKMYHKNIVRLYNVIENFKEIFLVMEYIPGQELFDYITYKKRLDEIESCKFFQQIISGIEYLSKTRVAHRDLKPENLLLDSKKTIK
jgi:5'-AMP-activated protein kinase catalytic alpha subunit